MNIIRIESAPSSNSLLKELSASQPLEEGTVLVVQNQTAGRGQTGNHWEAEPGKNLTMSILLYPSFLPLKNNFLLSKAVALGIKKALDSYIDHVRIKWPNDIYYQDHKITGILIENEITKNRFSKSVIGIGLNVNQEIFKSDAPNPISLKQILNVGTDLDLLMKNVTSQILEQYHKLKNGQIDEISNSYQTSLYRNEGYYPYSDMDGVFFARIESVENNGLLHLTTDQNEFRQYAFKEVKWL